MGKKIEGRPGPAIVFMGVSGCGKTVIGRKLADALGYRFIEGDEFHPPANIDRMKQGIPLDDAHRAGWLDAVGAAIASTAEDSGVIAACSALKRSYRDRLRRHSPTLHFVHLRIDKATARQRVAGRKGHFMPATLVDSQFEALEPLQEDEAGAVLDGAPPIDVLVRQAAGLIARWPHRGITSTA